MILILGCIIFAGLRKKSEKMKKTIYVLAAVLLLASCGTPAQISYYQDIDRFDLSVPVTVNHIKLRPEDKISIIVNTSNDQLTNLSNLPYVSSRIGQISQSVAYSNSQGISGYTLDANGDIDFPILGKVHVGGMTRDEVATHMKRLLVDNNLAKDVVVTVEFMNLSVSVLGEVTKPGRYAIEKDKLTLPEALAMAGDLTIYGKRDNVKVLRIENGVQKSYKVNLCRAQDVVTSPVYYIQQDDQIYVEPNDVRARQSTVNGNNVRSTLFWISLSSLAASIATLLIRTVPASR